MQQLILENIDFFHDQIFLFRRAQERAGGEMERESGQIPGEETEKERHRRRAGKGHHHPGPQDQVHHHR